MENSFNELEQEMKGFQNNNNPSEKFGSEKFPDNINNKEPSSIAPKNTNFEIEKSLIPTQKNIKTYYCKICNSFPEIKIKGNNRLIFSCEDLKTGERDFELLNKFLISQNESEEDLKKKLSCKTHLEQFKYYCNECKKNLCEKCFAEENSSHKDFIIGFKKKDDEIKYKEEFIEFYFKKIENENEKEKKKKIRTINPQNRKNNNNEDEDDENNNSNFKINKKYEKEQDEMEEEEDEEEKECENEENYIDYYLNIYDLYDIILKNKEKFPNYSHYLNIENIYYHLCDKLEIIYYFHSSIENIKIFGEQFVKSNINNCHLMIDNERVDLCENYKNNKNNKININNKKLKITLIKDNSITDMSYMFFGCKYLSRIKNKSKWNTDNVIDMKSMFYGCIALKKLPKNFSKWDTSKVTDFSNMFYKCECLKELPDISKWNTGKVKDLSGLFSECDSLKEIPNLSGWNTKNVTDMSYMFNNCFLLKNIPNLSKWKTTKVENFSNLFNGCESLKDLFNFYYWETNKVKDMSYMFADCKRLKKIKGLFHWETNNVHYINNMFENCSNLEKEIDLSQWELKNVITNKFSEGCLKKPKLKINIDGK